MHDPISMQGQPIKQSSRHGKGLQLAVYLRYIVLMITLAVDSVHNLQPCTVPILEGFPSVKSN